MMQRSPFTRSSLALVAISLTIPLFSGCSGCPGGIGVELPHLLIEPTTLVFESVAAGDENLQWLTLSNAGEADLVIESIRVVEGDPSVFMPLHDGHLLTIEPAGSVEIGVLYRSDGESVRASLSISSNDVRSGGDARVRMQVVVPDGRLFAAPNPVDFGRVPLGEIRTQEVMLHNLNVAPLELRDIFVEGNAFEIIDGELVNHEVAYLIVDQPRAVTVRYESQGQTDMGQLIIRHDQGIEHIEVLGNADGPCVRVDPPTIDFGVVEAGSFQERVVTIESCSIAPSTALLDVFGIELGAPPIHPASADLSLEEVAITPLSIPPEGDESFIARYAPTGLGQDRGVIVLETNDPLYRSIEIPMTGVGVRRVGPLALAGCRAAGSDGPFLQELVTAPLSTLECTAIGSEGNLLEYTWEAFESPGGSTVFTPANAADTSVFVPLAGRYQVGVTVFDTEGLTDTAFVDIVSLSDDDIRVELTWVTPADPDQHDTSGADIDLHFLHPNGCWEDREWDVHYLNPGPNWGARSSSRDDPKLDLDDTDGAGPENVSLRNPEDVRYRVAVHYFRDHEFGPSFATVRVYIRGVLVFERSNKEMPYTDAWWLVADVDWPSGDVTPLDVSHIGPPPPDCP